MTNKNCRCNACGCAFVPETLTQCEGEIEYNFFSLQTMRNKKRTKISAL